MKGIIVTGLVGLIFFGGAYAYSTMQLVSQKAAEEEGGEKEADDSDKTKTIAPTESNLTKSGLTKTDASKIPVPFPPKALPEDTLLELTNSIRKKRRNSKSEKSCSIPARDSFDLSWRTSLVKNGNTSRL